MNRPDLGGKTSRCGGFFVAVSALFLFAGGTATAAGPEPAAIACRIENVADTRYQTAYQYGAYGRSVYGGVRVKW